MHAPVSRQESTMTRVYLILRPMLLYGLIPSTVPHGWTVMLVKATCARGSGSTGRAVFAWHGRGPAQGRDDAGHGQ